MELKEGVKVYAADEKAVGHLSRVVIDPETSEVTHVVVRNGLLNKEDRVVLADEISSASQEKMTLKFASNRLVETPLFELEKQAPVSEIGGSRGMPEGLGSVHTHAGPEPVVMTEKRRTIPEELVALKEHTPVFSKDGERVGDVERVITHPMGDEVTDFIITKGWLLKARKKIPMGLVYLLSETGIYLSVGAKMIMDLPAYEEA